MMMTSIRKRPISTQNTSLVGFTKLAKRKKRSNSFRSHGHLVSSILVFFSCVVFCLTKLFWLADPSVGDERSKITGTIKYGGEGFPHHIGSEMEQIAHPGFLLSDQEKLRVLFDTMAIPTNITVPKFWSPAVLELREVGKRKSSVYSNANTESETIFVSVASYRDEKCTATVENLFLRAARPELLRVAIVDQRIPGQDPTCGVPDQPCSHDGDQVLCKFEHLIDRVEYDAQLMVGPTFARHIAHRMYRGEVFAMQVDSHVQFVADWDTDIIEQWKSTGNEKSVISTYLNNLSASSLDPPTHAANQDHRSMMCKSNIGWKGTANEHIKFSIQPSSKPRFKDTPMLQPFWAAGFSFARGHFLVQVPYDPFLPFVFQGEEISTTVRAWTSGYDFYAPSRNVAFHIYPDKSDPTSSGKLFTDNEVLFPGAKTRAYRRLNRLIGIHRTDALFFDLEAEKYGLGTDRSASLFFDLFGIDWRTPSIKDGLCTFVQGIGTRSMHEVLTPRLRPDGMGIDYSDGLSFPLF